jgi:hypothetical protein
VLTPRVAAAAPVTGGPAGWSAAGGTTITLVTGGASGAASGRDWIGAERTGAVSASPSGRLPVGCTGASMRDRGTGKGMRTLSRFALIGLIGGATAACSTDAVRLDPFSNPFSSSASGEPGSPARRRRRGASAPGRRRAAGS